MVTGEDRTFQLNGVSDGDYEISAIGGGPEMVASSARHVSVKGADVTGIELVLAPLASISGRVNIEADQKLNCGRRRDAALRETLISVRRDRVEEKSEAKTSKDKSAQATEPVSLSRLLRKRYPTIRVKLISAVWLQERIASKRVCPAPVGI